MNDTPEQRQAALQNIVLALAIAAVVTSLIGSTTDAFESLWASTRGMEFWELDEILLGLALAPTAGLIVAAIQIRQLNRRMSILESGGPIAKASQRAATHVPRVGTIVKCTYCAKIKSEDETWLGEDDYISHRCDATVVAGVCPSCRQGVPSKPA